MSKKTKPSVIGLSLNILFKCDTIPNNLLEDKDKMIAIKNKIFRMLLDCPLLPNEA